MMGLFKSKAERKRERDMEVRKGLQAIKRNIKSLEKDIQGYREKAVRAKQMNASENLDFLKLNIRRSITQMRLQERQLLSIETAVQMKNQAENLNVFAKSMTAVSRSIAEVFNSTDLDATLDNYEKAMTQAEDMEQRMNIFLDSSEDVTSMMGDESEMVDMSEIDHIIDEDVLQSESAKLGKRIDEKLSQLDNNIGLKN